MKVIPAHPAEDAGLDLSVGALVVYGGHGLGRVTGHGQGTGENADRATILLAFTSGLSVTLPVDRAGSCLRAPADAQDFKEVRAVLSSPNETVEQSWQARTRSARRKIAIGDPVGLAEVVRDGLERRRGLAVSSRPSLAEQQLYRKARGLLTAELALAADIEESEAETWIENQLERPGE